MANEKTKKATRQLIYKKIERALTKIKGEVKEKKFDKKLHKASNILAKDIVKAAKKEAPKKEVAKKVKAKKVKAEKPVAKKVKAKKVKAEKPVAPKAKFKKSAKKAKASRPKANIAPVVTDAADAS